ncbi:MAG: BtpA/SgcQ family protein [Acidimicrobiia bacterium]|nr:BtpA/SgcQ family protein [Acidimicrobiia bacterium]MBT8218088.1 BtpA/SgcQ family protein [Acidimicrobiia bacterium]NNL71011.1 BtpA/SgcQ family protein [Acidimicrobiia bacterium]
MNRLIGVVHLPALPGAPAYVGGFEDSLRAAAEDARRLRDSGFDAVIVENFGDAPFFADNVPAVTVASMTRAVATIRNAVDLPVGVNVLRNDAHSALAVAAATGAAFIRVNVLTGAMTTDQGVITGRAAEVMRARHALGVETEVYADVLVKHAVPPPGLTIESATADTVKRGMADAVIVSGEATGDRPDLDLVRRAATAAGGVPVLIGSGATEDNVAELLEVAAGVIVGTSIKQDQVTTNPVDPARAAAFVKAAG